MSKIVTRRTLIAAIALVAVISSVSFVLKAARPRETIKGRSSFGNQRTILWAWERPTDLSFIDPVDVGVAFLAQTIRLGDEKLIVRPRLQTLNVPNGTNLVAVTRIEVNSADSAALTQRQSLAVAQNIAETATLPHVLAIQIDFDATQSQRRFYQELIADVRSRLPKDVRLSITALASWCAEDDWISKLPIDEAVPMLFRMGPDREQVRNLISTRQEFSAAICRRSFGISTDEPIENLDQTKRLYIFNPQPWTKESVRTVLESRK